MAQLFDDRTRWIWMPCGRTLANTVVLFRREFRASSRSEMKVRLTADSRYLLWVNGHRIGFGPAPCDPRRLDVDEYTIPATALREGANCVGIEVLFYGHGEGTWAAGAPGLIGQVEVDGKVEFGTDGEWMCLLDRSRPPGMYKRSYTRALQEIRDERRRPATRSGVRWTEPGYDLVGPGEGGWAAAEVIVAATDRPIVFGPGRDYSTDAGAIADAEMPPALVRREVAYPTEVEVEARAVEAHRVVWCRDPADWFEQRVPGSFSIEVSPAPDATGPWTLGSNSEREAGCVTFELPEQMVGFEFVELTAPTGTIVELLPQESHELGRSLWLDTHAFSWSRYTCAPGEHAAADGIDGHRQRFEVTDYDSLRWLQVSVRNNAGPVVIHRVGVRRRTHVAMANFRCDVAEAPLQRLVEATRNTLANACIETAVDGMGRERQQYSGDCGHQLAVFRAMTGDTTLYRRYLQTWAMGLTKEGYFLDCWPAFDRLNRIQQRQLGLTEWGPILDHGVGFAFDAQQYLRQTGDAAGIAFPFRQLAKFFKYLQRSIGDDGLLPVERLGIPSVWIDHEAFRCQRDKRLAWNLYVAHAARDAWAPLAVALGEDPGAYVSMAAQLLSACQRVYWSAELGTYVNNLATAKEEGVRLDDRSLSHAVLGRMCVNGDTAASLDRLRTLEGTGLSYPANAIWRLSALAGDSAPASAHVVAQELRTRWARMRSVVENNSIAEFWSAPPSVVAADSRAQWSHCAVAPLHVLCLAAGLTRYERGLVVLPLLTNDALLAQLPAYEMTVYDVGGPMHFRWDGREATARR